MSRHAYLRRARHWIANRGWKGFLREVWYRVKLKLRGQPTPGRENGNAQPHPFDLAYGTDTGGLVWGEDLRSADRGSSAFWTTGYYGISPSAFTAALERLHLDWPRFTFVDVGCGKGRALLLASRLPFQQIVGIELSPELASVALENVRRFSAPWRSVTTSMSVLPGDATSLALPAGALVLFLYHPFAAPVMRRFLEHVREAASRQKRDILLLYANPELCDMLTREPGVEWLWREVFALTPEEGEADRFGSHGEIFSAYRIVPVLT